VRQVEGAGVEHLLKPPVFGVRTVYNYGHWLSVS
jgi:hypothetical protein